MGLFASLDSRSNPLVPWHALSADVSSESGLTRASEAVLTSALVRLASPTLWPRRDAETLSARALFSLAAIFGVHLPAGPRGRVTCWPWGVLPEPHHEGSSYKTFLFLFLIFRNCYLMPWSFKPNFLCRGSIKKKKKKNRWSWSWAEGNRISACTANAGWDIQYRDGKWNRKSVMRKSCFCRLQSFSHCVLSHLNIHLTEVLQVASVTHRCPRTRGSLLMCVCALCTSVTSRGPTPADETVFSFQKTNWILAVSVVQNERKCVSTPPPPWLSQNDNLVVSRAQ